MTVSSVILQSWPQCVPPWNRFKLRHARTNGLEAALGDLCPPKMFEDTRQLDDMPEVVLALLVSFKISKSSKWKIQNHTIWPHLLGGTLRRILKTFKTHDIRSRESLRCSTWETNQGLNYRFSAHTEVAGANWAFASKYVFWFSHLQIYNIISSKSKWFHLFDSTSCLSTKISNTSMKKSHRYFLSMGSWIL